MLYDIWRHNHWSNVQLELRAPSRDLAQVLHIFFNVFLKKYMEK